jgi:hypothetical protein
MVSKILGVVDDMIKKSDETMRELEQTNDLARKRELMSSSLKQRTDAANLLNNFKQENPGPTSEAVLKKLYTVLESLYKDLGEGTTALGLQRGEQLTTLTHELVQELSYSDSIPYRTRLLELEWDRRSLQGIIDQGKDLLDACQKAGSDDYDARRYIAMALYDNLPDESYNLTTYRLPPSVFPETMDELLDKLYAQKPEDIEIAKRYAEFIVGQDHQEQNRRNISPGARATHCVTKRRMSDVLMQKESSTGWYEKMRKIQLPTLPVITSILAMCLALQHLLKQTLIWSKFWSYFPTAAMR